MARKFGIHILLYSDDIQELVAQGHTIWETLEIARDVNGAKKRY